MASTGDASFTCCWTGSSSLSDLSLLTLPMRPSCLSVACDNNGMLQRIISSCLLTLLHSERPKLHTILVFLSAVG